MGRKGQVEALWVRDMFIIILVMITTFLLYLYVKTYLTVHLKYVHLVVCQIYLKKAEKWTKNPTTNLYPIVMRL